MSHFTVAVFTDGTKTIEELLAPFNESLEFEPYVCLTRQQIIDSALKRKKDFIMRHDSGEEISEWMQKYIDAHTEEELYNCEYDEDSNYDEYGNELSTYNPNSKWDWYSIGGRWNGMLKAKNGLRGEGGLCTPLLRESGKYDIAKVSDIDFSQNKAEYSRALRWWEVVVEGAQLTADEDKRDYLNFYNLDYLKKKYGNKETYATCQSVFSTFAVVLPDGKWYEKGKMGWWATVSDEDLEWDLKYKERFIDTADPEWTLTIVDCHI